MRKKKQEVCDVKNMVESIFIIFIIIGALATIAYYYVNINNLLLPPLIYTSTPTPTTTTTASVYDSLDGCDLFSGRWIHDNYSYPLYNHSDCPYIFGDFACQQYGKMDSKYQQWRWQPHACTLPRFEAKEVLERLRGKRVIFVGDSVNRNQWVSMVCMLQSVIPLGMKKMLKVPDVSMLTFKAYEYEISIDFYWAPMLVESNGDHPKKHKAKDRIVRIESIEKHAKNWVNADILVFNSYLWWRMPTIKIMNGPSQDSEQYNIVDNHRAYKMALKTWSDWLLTHINHTRTQSYFISMSATHHRGVEWGMKSYENCLNETEPIMKEGFWESGSDMKMLKILQSSLNKLRARRVNVQMMNITQLTQYRKDAHPSIYRLHYSPLTNKQLANPSSYADCSHWCLPGVPDVWNELLLAHVLRKRETLWIKWIPGKINIFLWRLSVNGLPTKDNLLRRNITLNSTLCPLCGFVPESVDHLFVQCRVITPIWSSVGSWCRIPIRFLDVNDLRINAFRSSLEKKKAWIFSAICAAVLWVTWRHRNNSIYSNSCGKTYRLFDDAKEEAFWWLKARTGSRYSVTWESWNVYPFSGV